MNGTQPLFEVVVAGESSDWWEVGGGLGVGEGGREYLPRSASVGGIVNKLLFTRGHSNLFALILRLEHQMISLQLDGGAQRAALIPPFM